MESSTDGKYRIITRRRIPAPRQVVFDAWIDPEGIKEWMCPGDVLSAEATLDIRVGGSFRIVMKRQNAVHEHTGIYQVVDPPSKLVFTWAAVENPGQMTLVTVEFFSQGEDCELVLTHERFPTADMAQRYENGWGTIAEKFAAFLALGKTKQISTNNERKQEEWGMANLMDTTTEHPVVSHEEWLKARTAFLAKEKEFTRLRDELSEQRRQLPWERVEKDYRFEGPNGSQSLADVFENRSQLVVYHFMFNPASDQGCKHCSFWADNFNSIIIHLNHRDVTFAVISRAPLARIAAFQNRMGWTFNWFSSAQTDFNYDFQASFTPEAIQSGSLFYNYKQQKMNAADREGVSVFYKDASGVIFHTYSAYARGIDLLNTAYNYLDLVPKGRDEGDSPQSWVRHHDRYQD